MMDGLQSLRRHISSGRERGVDNGTYKTSAGITSHTFNKPQGFFLFFLVDLSPGKCHNNLQKEQFKVDSRDIISFSSF